ncbi:MAG: menaquinone biosynthetic enzyme MqnA/MqnD family protein [Elusimicrobiota bacterium]
MSVLIGRISYVNTDPWFYQWKGDHSWKMISDSPSQLGQLAIKEQLTAAPLSIFDYWKIEDHYEPLGNWGISSKEICQSVFIISKKKLTELSQAHIAATTESSTSIQLAKLIFEKKYNLETKIQRGFQDTDMIRLVIGDEALKIGTKRNEKEWPYIYDLATEWWQWHKKPFVFARWVIKKNIQPQLKNDILQAVALSFSSGMDRIKEMSAEASRKTGVSAHQIENYIKGFKYNLTSEESEGIQLFRNQINQNKTMALI